MQSIIGTFWLIIHQRPNRNETSSCTQKFGCLLLLYVSCCMENHAARIEIFTCCRGKLIHSSLQDIVLSIQRTTSSLYCQSSLIMHFLENKNISVRQRILPPQVIYGDYSHTHIASPRTRPWLTDYTLPIMLLCYSWMLCLLNLAFCLRMLDLLWLHIHCGVGTAAEVTYYHTLLMRMKHAQILLSYFILLLCFTFPPIMLE